jgi:tRNA-dihydrouridine synthase B
LTLALTQTPFRIGSVVIRNRVALAPMSGVTDLPFRELALEFGAGFVMTEMVASRELAGNTSESWARLRQASLGPHIVQLAGRDPHLMAEGARIAEANGADVIDINMGCPAKKVIGGLSGSALMREPALALAIIDAVVGAVKVPVSVKMRLGWDDQSINAPMLAREAELRGAAMITVHGRTRMQFYEGRADWARIADVRERVSVPLVANGDIETAGDIDRVLTITGADAVMIGRGAQGRPWHAGVLAGFRNAPTGAELAAIFARHYRMMLDFHGREAGLRHARKHVGWYIDRIGLAEPQMLKAKLLTSTDPDTIIAEMARHIIGDGHRPTTISEAA